MTIREIVLDTETTGLNHEDGDRIVEIGCVVLENLVPTGQSFHCYVNPERSMSAEAAAVHGLTDAFLADKPVFADIADALLDFIGDAPLIIHNAPFDLGFLHAELTRLGRALPDDLAVVDTLVLARQKFPGAAASLDALCRRFDIDNSAREKHGALLDAELLAEVYLQLRGGRQTSLADFDMAGDAPHSVESPNMATDAPPSVSPAESPSASETRTTAPRRPTPLATRLSEADKAAHQAFLKTLPHAPIWLQ